tara:strand:+ start:1264 stop:1581 length:318 start_codon:yes stop_codon:yes gene_type:complete
MPSDYSKEHIKQMMDPKHDQSAWKQDTFWEHYCKKEQDVLGFPKGVECDWCGETEATGNKIQTAFQKKQNKTTGEKLFGYHPQELLTSKILPIDVFYKLFGQSNE